MAMLQAVQYYLSGFICGQSYDEVKQYMLYICRYLDNDNELHARQFFKYLMNECPRALPLLVINIMQFHMGVYTLN